MPATFRRSIVWLRRDLRLRDNVALERACRASAGVALAFVVDPELLARESIGAPLVQAFFSALGALRADLRERGSDVVILRGEPEVELARLARRIDAQAVFFNEDYEPFARSRDGRVEAALRAAGLEVFAHQDHVYFGAHEIQQDSGAPYRVFTPFKRKWLERFHADPRPVADSFRALRGKPIGMADLGRSQDVPTPEAFGFQSSPAFPRCSERLANERLAQFARRGGPIERYTVDRDIPALDGTSRLSVALRAGTIGIRTCFEAARSAAAWMNELIWREFYQTILARFPYVAEGPFLDAGKRIVWRDSERDFEAWCAGRTGYPIVDAAMRELNRTGWMHNRLRMISASFLVKHLLIDWRLGERYFERRLSDADLAQNNGGWQWCASTGTDAVPYFRIFNPAEQARKFDPEGAYVRRILPPDYDVAPIVEHAFARQRALETYARAFRK